MTPEPGGVTAATLNCPISRGMLSLDKLHSFGDPFSGGEGPAVLLLVLSLLSAPGNASDARIPQERALIFLRHPHSPYMPRYYAYN